MPLPLSRSSHAFHSASPRPAGGRRMRAVGANPHAAGYAGMGVAGTTFLSMAIAGGLAGLLRGSLLVLKQGISMWKTRGCLGSQVFLK